MEDLSVRTILPVWWAFIWRMIVFGGIGGFTAGLFIGIVLGAIGLPQYITVASTTAGYLLSIPISMYVMLIALTRYYREVRIERKR